mgnify:FL=1
MKYLLDSNAVIALLNKNPDFIQKITQYIPQDFALSSIVLFELTFGAYKSQKTAENLAKLAKLPFEQADAQCAGEIRADLQRQGTPIGAYDVLIAGQAVAQDLVLITHNVQEFSRVAQLKFEDWQPET